VQGWLAAAQRTKTWPPLLRQLAGDLRVVEEHHLEREYSFANFRDALAFTKQVGALAEAQNHHPNIIWRGAG